ncbi:MAG: ABC transporter permease [Lachnospiraceae bacterium]|jgi:simple sugar transport system permease protein|nr:ABC transporter permease [Lachnospiraceae bacterium]
MMNTITLLLGVTLLYSTPMVFGALGGVLSERSGVVNIGIEGMMTFGAFAGAAAGYYSGNPWVGVLCAAAAGGILALLHAVAAISCQADQTISGVAINLLGPALAVFFCRQAFDGATMSYPVENKLPKMMGSGVEGMMANLNVDVMVLVALLFAVAMWFVLYRTKWGLRVLAVGENPAAADTLGINVYKTRYACVILSGILAGIGGATVTLGIVAQFTQTSIAGQGFIALAAVIFGKWKPLGAYKACLIFGFSQALTVVLGGGALAVPTEILAMLPYVLTIIILILFIGKSVAPKADGVPYVKGKR